MPCCFGKAQERPAGQRIATFGEMWRRRGFHTPEPPWDISEQLKDLYRFGRGVRPNGVKGPL